MGNARLEALHAHALALPGAWLDSPWGEDHWVVKAKNGKIFLFATEDENGNVQISVKLSPEEVQEAKMLPFVGKARYLSAVHWIAATISNDFEMETAMAWTDRSYELVAKPKTRARKQAE